jgi:hypothetical protein
MLSANRYADLSHPPLLRSEKWQTAQKKYLLLRAASEHDREANTILAAFHEEARSCEVIWFAIICFCVWPWPCGATGDVISAVVLCGRSELEYFSII